MPAPGVYHWKVRAILENDPPTAWVDGMQFELKAFAPDTHGFSFKNNTIDPSLTNDDIYSIFTTAFNLTGIDDTEQLAQALFPAGYFDSGLCYGMGRTALMRYSSAPFVQQHFDDFWQKVHTSEPSPYPDFLANLTNTNFLLSGKWDRRAVEGYTPLNIPKDPVLNMIIRMQMWKKVNYGEQWKATGPKDVVEFLQGDHNPFGSYGITIILDSSQDEAHFLVPYKVEEQDINGKEEYDISVYDPNRPYDPDHPERQKKLHFSYEGDGQQPQDWKWTYTMLGLNGGDEEEEGDYSTIFLHDYATLTGNETLPAPPSPTPTPTPTPTP